MTWVHTDPDLGSRSAAALQRALDADWATATVADWRALLASSAYLQAQLAGEVRPTTDLSSWASWASWLIAPGAMIGQAIGQVMGETIAAGAAGYALRADYEGTLDPRQRAARLLAETHRILAVRTAAELAEELTDVDIVTSGSNQDAGALPAAAVVVLVAIGVVGISYLAFRASTVLDRQLQRSSDARELVRIDAQAQRLLGLHLSEEAKAGQQLQFSAATKAALALLESRQAAILGRARPAGAGGGEWWMLGVGLAAAAGVYFWSHAATR